MTQVDRSRTVPAPATAGGGVVQPYWLINNGALKNLLDAGLPTRTMQAIFNSPKTLLIANDGRADPLVPDASLVQTFDDLGSLRRALSSGQVPPSVSFVLLDLEHWSFTPISEQLQPFQDAHSALTLAHSYGKKLIFAPAANLALVQSGNESGDKYGAYLGSDFAGQGARVSDIFEIQAQQSEATPQALTFALAAVRQAKASASIPVLVGIGTNPAGRPVTAADITALAGSVKSAADGYWLNVPQGGPRCPACGSAQPDVAVSFLQGFA